MTQLSIPLLFHHLPFQLTLFLSKRTEVVDSAGRGEEIRPENPIVAENSLLPLNYSSSQPASERDH